MIDYEADADLMDRILDAVAEVTGDEEREAVAGFIAEADREDLPNAAILGRLLQTTDVSMVNDVSHVLGVIAEAQQIWQDHVEDIDSDVVQLLLTQMAMGITILGEHPGLPLAGLETVRSRYEQLSLQYGVSLRVPYRFGMVLATRRGDRTRALDYLAKLEAQPLDAYFPDVRSDDIECLTTWGDDLGAIHVYRGIDFSTGKASLVMSHAAAILPLLRTGQPAEAERAYRASLPDDEPLSQVLSYLGLVGRLDEGLARLATILAPDPEDPETERGHAVTAEHAVVLLEQLRAAGRGDERPEGLGGQSVDELADRFRREAEAAALKADRVNTLSVAMPRLQRFWSEHIPGWADDHGAGAVGVQVD